MRNVNKILKKLNKNDKKREACKICGKDHIGVCLQEEKISEQEKILEDKELFDVPISWENIIYTPVPLNMVAPEVDPFKEITSSEESVNSPSDPIKDRKIMELQAKIRKLKLKIRELQSKNKCMEEHLTKKITDCMKAYDQVEVLEGEVRKNKKKIAKAKKALFC